MLIPTALTSGLVMATILTVLILASLAHHPRIWFRRVPKEMQDALPPMTEAETSLLKRWAIPIFGVTFLMPLATAYWYEQNYGQMNYGEAFLFLYLMWMVFNLVDLVIIDWLVVVWWEPEWSTVPEAKPLMHLVGYAYHFKGFLKGTVILAVAALIFAAIVMLI
jgi:hypothetical protein